MPLYIQKYTHFHKYMRVPHRKYTGKKMVTNEFENVASEVNERKMYEHENDGRRRRDKENLPNHELTCEVKIPLIHQK